MNKTLITLAITALFAGTLNAAPGDAVPNTFSNGTPADADQVNANFTEVVNQISTLATEGVVGPEGPQGPAGPQGIQGEQGIQGLTGNTGSQGIQGLTGATGPQGSQGLKGDKGDKGDIGLTGDKGDKGDIGLTGDKGDKGDIGLTGDKGDKGDIGLTGDKGDKGDIGLTGSDGISISSITDDGAGTLTINLDNGSSSTHSIPSTTTYSYRDHAHTYNTKTFVAQDTSGAFTQEVRTFDRTVTGQVSFLRHRTGGTADKMDTIVLDNSGPELRMIQFDRHGTLDPNTVTESRTMAPGVLFRTETMEQGKTFGSDSLLSRDGTPSSGVLQTAAVIAVNQSVTVPAGSYTGCIKISRHRAARHLGQTYDRINTFCPGLGLVRQLHTSLNFSTGNTETVLKELSTCDSGACTQP